MNQGTQTDAAPAARHGKGSGVATTAAHHRREFSTAATAAYPGILKHVYHAKYGHKSHLCQCEAVRGRTTTTREE
eukprot:220854-Amphidinium_carterae.1